MNLFILDLNHSKNARYHVDKHVGKMILESVQLLCTQFHLQGIEAPYKKTHQNHPCSIFCRASRDNFLWVLDYAMALHNEFKYRYGKCHKSGQLTFWILNNMEKLSFPKTEMTEFVLAMPDQYKSDDPVQSYREYYKRDKSHLFKWTDRTHPHWVISEESDKAVVVNIMDKERINVINSRS